MAKTLLRLAPLALLGAVSCQSPAQTNFGNLDFPIPGGIGRIYTHVRRPLDVNYDRTETSLDTRRGDVRRITYSNLRVDWGENAIGELGRQAGFEEVLYADLETFSILGIWTQNWVHIYGR